MNKWLVLSIIVVLVVIGNIAIYSLRNRRVEPKNLTKDASSIERLSLMLKSMKHADKVEFWIENPEDFENLSEKVKALEQEIIEDKPLKDNE